MAIIKKPMRKSLFYLSLFLAAILILIGKLFGFYQDDLIRLESKAKKILAQNLLIYSVRADVPNNNNSGDGGAGGGGSGGGADSSGGGGGGGGDSGDSGGDGGS